MPKPRISFEQVPLEAVMETLLREVVSFVQAMQKDGMTLRNILMTSHAILPTMKDQKWQLLAACYQERAQLHRDLVARVQPWGANGAPLTESER